MNFEFNENQNDLRAMVRELAEKEIGPRAKENDEKDVFPVEIFKMMADMGLTAIGVPEEFGGPEATDIERMIAIEEIAKKDGAVATILAVHGMLIQALVKYGTDEQKKRFLPRIAEEGYYTAFALTEPGAGSDPLPHTTMLPPKSINADVTPFLFNTRLTASAMYPLAMPPKSTLPPGCNCAVCPFTVKQR